MALTFKSVSEPRQRVYRAYPHLWGYLGCWKGLSRFYGAHLGRVDTGILILCGAVFFWLLRQLTALTAEKIHSEKRLQESESELRKLNDLKNTFLGIAAHDLRNPLSVIGGMSKMIMKFELSEEKKRNIIETINRASTQMLALVNDFPDYALSSAELVWYK